jgi:hypothetical protein
MLKADGQRLAVGAASAEYRRITAPVDRSVLRLQALVARHPVLTSAGLALGGLLVWRRRGKLSGLMRGAMMGIGIVKALRGR